MTGPVISLRYWTILWLFALYFERNLSESKKNVKHLTILFQNFARSGYLTGPLFLIVSPLNWDSCLFKLLDPLKKSTVASNDWNPPKRTLWPLMTGIPPKEHCGILWTAPCDTRPFWHSQTKILQDSFLTSQVIVISKNNPPKHCTSFMSTPSLKRSHP